MNELLQKIISIFKKERATSLISSGFGGLAMIVMLMNNNKIERENIFDVVINLQQVFRIFSNKRKKKN